MSDDKMELPFCVAFGMRYWKRVRAKVDMLGADWMTSKFQKDWILACQVFYLLHLLIDDDEEERDDYKVLISLGSMLIDLVSSVDTALKKIFADKKEN